MSDRYERVVESCIICLMVACMRLRAESQMRLTYSATALYLLFREPTSA